MKKIGFVCMLATTFYAYATQARVCLLGDPNCNSGISVERVQRCDDYISEHPEWVAEHKFCNALDYELACEDNMKTYYRATGCKPGYIDINEMGKSYVCGENVECGQCCPSAKCDPDKFKHCEAPTIGDPDSDICQEYNNQYKTDGYDYKYSSCICNTDVYKYNSSNCTKTGFRLEGESCTGDNGTWWTECNSIYEKCEDWNPSSYGTIPAGKKCDNQTKIELRNGSIVTCYINCYVDCEYYDNYYNQQDCEDAIEHSTCIADKDSCWYFNGCTTGYKVENGICVADCKYEDKEDCEKSNSNSVCTTDTYGCYVPTDCKDGYKGDGTDCEPATCPTGSSTEFKDVKKCGYPSTTGAKSTPTGDKSGEKDCYECSCAPDTKNVCKWNDSNKGEKGTLSEVCCDGKSYETCTKNFPNDVTVPANATGKTTSYTACGETKDIITSWECNADDGYVKNSAGTGCEPATCPTNSSVDYKDVNKCGYPSTTGAKSTATGDKSGGKDCYECSCAPDTKNVCKWNDSNKGEKGTLSEVCCDGKSYKTCTKNFPNDVTVPANATGKTTSYTACGETKDVITSWECNDNYVKSGDKCEPATCPTNSSVDYKDVNKCGYPSTIGAKVTAVAKSGDKDCYECSCAPDTNTCKWSNTNKGENGTLSEVCCDGKTYKTCTKNFPSDVTVPANATGKTTSYKACGETKDVITSWECKSGYVKNSTGTGCELATCPTGSSTEYKDVSKCGYPSTTGAKSTSTGVTSVNGDCYKCSCNCGSEYKWTNSNKGNAGKLGAQCCNGSYTCTKNFPSAVSVPANATGKTTSYTACGETKNIITSWECNTGYTKSGDKCVPNCTYADKDTCEKSLDYSSCTQDSSGCYNVTGCVTGYKPYYSSSKIVECYEIIGSVFYSDSTFGPASRYDSSKTPIGIIYHINNDNGTSGKIINLAELKANPSTYNFEATNPYNSNGNYIMWGLSYTDVSGIKNYTGSTLMDALKNKTSEIVSGSTNTTTLAKATYNSKAVSYDGGDCSKSNTKDYAKYCQGSSAKAAIAFYPPNVSSTHSKYGAGKWHMFSAGEWAQLCISGDYSTEDMAASGDSLYITGLTNDMTVKNRIYKVAKINKALGILNDKGVTVSSLAQASSGTGESFDSSEKRGKLHRIVHESAEDYDGYIPFAYVGSYYTGTTVMGTTATTGTVQFIANFAFKHSEAVLRVTLDYSGASALGQQCTSSNSNCKWTNSNKGTYGELSKPCCDGTYETCTKVFPSITIPSYATATTTTYEACGTKQAVATGWTCNTNYVKSGNSCVCDSSIYNLNYAPDNSNYNTCTDGSGKHYKFNSCKSCYKKKTKNGKITCKKKLFC